MTLDGGQLVVALTAGATWAATQRLRSLRLTGDGQGAPERVGRAPPRTAAPW